MWKLTIEDDQAIKTVVHLVRDEYGIGRAEENAIRLTERNISRLHAQLERKNEHWSVRDLSSYNGCYVNGQRVAGTQELSHGDLLQVGDYRLSLENEVVTAAGLDTETVPAPRAATPNSAIDRLVMLVGPTPGAEFALGTGRMLIGRADDSDIALNHASVSRVHAELTPVGEGRYEIIDRQSANGVRVNGVELPRSFIDARDVVELGDVILKFIPAGQTYIPAADESLQIAAIGAARRQEAEEGIAHVLNRSSSLKWIALAGLVLLAVALVLLLRRNAPAELVSIRDETSDRAEKILADAKHLLADGDARGAYQKSVEIPPAASARRSPDFREIQAAYADALFAQADKASDPTDKRNLYDEIARAPTVDSGRRSKAAALLAQIPANAVNVADLPSTPEEAEPAPTQATPPTRHAPAAPVQTAADATTHTPPPRSSAAPPKGVSTLVRETPF